MSKVYAVLAVSNDIVSAAEEKLADDAAERAAEAEEAKERLDDAAEDLAANQEDKDLDEQAKADREAARLAVREERRAAAKEARRVERIERNLRERQRSREEKMLARFVPMARLWGEASWGDPPVTRRAYVLIEDASEIRGSIRRLRNKWPDAGGDARVQVGCVVNPDGSDWKEYDPETGEVVREYGVAGWLWRFMGQVQDGEDAEGNPIMRDRRRSDPWVMPNVVAGWTPADFGATQDE